MTRHSQLIDATGFNSVALPFLGKSGIFPSGRAINCFPNVGQDLAKLKVGVNQSIWTVRPDWNCKEMSLQEELTSTHAGVGKKKKEEEEEENRSWASKLRLIKLHFVPFSVWESKCHFVQVLVVRGHNRARHLPVRGERRAGVRSRPAEQAAAVEGNCKVSHQD